MSFFCNCCLPNLWSLPLPLRHKPFLFALFTNLIDIYSCLFLFIYSYFQYSPIHLFLFPIHSSLSIPILIFWVLWLHFPLSPVLTLTSSSHHLVLFHLHLCSPSTFPVNLSRSPSPPSWYFLSPLYLPHVYNYPHPRLHLLASNFPAFKHITFPASFLLLYLPFSSSLCTLPPFFFILFLLLSSYSCFSFDLPFSSPSSFSSLLPSSSGTCSSLVSALRSDHWETL